MVQIGSNVPSDDFRDMECRRRKLSIDTNMPLIVEPKSIRNISISCQELKPRSPHLLSPYLSSPNLFEWKELKPENGENPPEMSGISANFVDDILYIFGGYHAPNQFDGSAQDILYTYDIHQRSWTNVKTTGSRPSPRTSHSTVVDELANKLYVICGSGSYFGATNHSDVFELNLALHSWRRLHFTGPELSPRYGQTAVLYSDQIYIFGGTSGREFSQEFFSLNLKTLCSRKLPMIGSVPSPRYKHAAGIFDRDKMLIFGGSEHHNRYLDDVYAVNLNSLIWIRMECHGTKPGGRFAHGFCIHNDKAFVFGGNEDQGADLYILYIHARKWTKIDCSGSIPRGRLFIGMTFDHSRSTLMVWGGKEASANPRRVSTLHAMIVEKGKDSSDYSSLSDDLISLLRSGMDSDLIVNDLYSAHQLIMRCRCPQLADCIVYGERGPSLRLPYHNSAIQVLLHFIYSDEIPHDPVDEDVLLSTLIAACDLGFPRLTALCDRCLRRRITLERAVRWLQILNGDDRVLLVSVLNVYIESHQPREGERSSVDLFPIIPRVEIPHSTLRLDFCRLRKMSWIEADTESIPFDLRFQCGQSKKRLYAHRLILSTRSRYFGSFAFREGMREGATGLCKFPPPTEGVLSSRALEALLDYLYCDGIKVDEEEAKELLRIDVVNFFGLTTKHLKNMLKARLDSGEEVNFMFPYDSANPEPIKRCSLS